MMFIGFLLSRLPFFIYFYPHYSLFSFPGLIWLIVLNSVCITRLSKTPTRPFSSSIFFKSLKEFKRLFNLQTWPALRHMHEFCSNEVSIFYKGFIYLGTSFWLIIIHLYIYIHLYSKQNIISSSPLVVNGLCLTCICQDWW